MRGRKFSRGGFQRVSGNTGAQMAFEPWEDDPDPPAKPRKEDQR